MSVQAVLFVVAICAFIAAAVCAGLAVYVYRSQDIPSVKADLAGELRQIESKGTKKGRKDRGKKTTGPSFAKSESSSRSGQADDGLTVFGQNMADDTGTVAKGSDDSPTVIGAHEGDGDLEASSGEPSAAIPPAPELRQLEFKVTHKQVDVHSDKDIPTSGRRR